MFLSIVIPVYCSEKIICEVYKKLIQSLSSNNFKYEIIFVDDCSLDDSWNIIKKLCKNDIRLKAISLNKNYGQHNAIFCGIKNSVGDLIVTMDDDLQHPPEEINKLINEIIKGYDVVYGISKKLNHSIIRNFFSNFIKNVIRIFMGFDQAQNINSFRVFKRNLLDDFVNIRNSKINIDVLLSWSTKNFSSIYVRHNKREKGSSGYTFGKLFNHSITMITNFSNVPLKIASYLGFIFSIFGLLVLMYVIITFLFFSYPVKGFPFLASIISIFSGVQLLTLGIFGEYLSNIHSKSISKPMYVIKEIIKNK